MPGGFLPGFFESVREVSARYQFPGRVTPGGFTGPGSGVRGSGFGVRGPGLRVRGPMPGELTRGPGIVNPGRLAGL